MNDIIIKIAYPDLEEYRELTLKNDWHELVLLAWDGEEAAIDISCLNKPFSDDLTYSLPGMSCNEVTDTILNMLTCLCILRTHEAMMTAVYCAVHHEYTFTSGNFASPCEDDPHIIVVIKTKS